MDSVLVAQCLQNDVVSVTIPHYLKMFGDRMHLLCLPGALRQICENDLLMEHILDNYESIIIDGHRNCAYYGLLGFSGDQNYEQQKKDLREITKKMLPKKLETGFVEEDSKNIFIRNSKIRKKYPDALVDSVLVYPVDCWQESFEFMDNYLSNSRVDRYGYFPNGPASFDKMIEKYKNDIINVSFNKHKAKKLIFIVEEEMKKENKKIIVQISNFVDEMKKKFDSADYFSVDKKTELIICA